MKRIFISDLHLDADREDLTLAFLRFLDEGCKDIDELYILGDFFELWLGDDNQSYLTIRIIDALATLTARVFVMHGNRDFLLGEKFCHAANATLLSDPHKIKFENQDALLMHGDSLCTNDKEYMEARNLLRSKEFKQNFLSKKIQERSIIAAQIRGKSRQVSREKANDIMDVTQEEVIRVMNKARTSILIHGHTHRPAVHKVKLKFGNGTRYVLGDWDTSMRFLQSEGTQLELIRYTF